jgi:hypothetical protein
MGHHSLLCHTSLDPCCGEACKYYEIALCIKLSYKPEYKSTPYFSDDKISFFDESSENSAIKKYNKLFFIFIFKDPKIRRPFCSREWHLNKKISLYIRDSTVHGCLETNWGWT